MVSRQLASAASATLGMLVLAGCSTQVDGNPVSSLNNPFLVAGLPVTDGPNGLRSDAPDPFRDPLNSDGGEIDELSAGAISDVEEFWEEVFSTEFDGRFVPVDEIVSYDATERPGIVICGEDTEGFVNAFFCGSEDIIGWDRGVLMPSVRASFGDMGVVKVIAHEYGHSLQLQAGLVDDRTPTLVSEQQADCLAGVYLRWVAEGDSPRFTLNTGDGLNDVLGATISVRDEPMSADQVTPGSADHGSAFERVTALQMGFTSGAPACAAIDEEEVAQRRGVLPVLLPEDETGELPVSEDSVRSVVDALNIVFAPAEEPGLVFDRSPDPCDDAESTPPVSYCPSSNTIAVDIRGLRAAGESFEDPGDSMVLGGDNTAYSMLTSRYMLAIQREEGLVLDNPTAAMRTACLTGVATAKLAGGDGNADDLPITLTAGDLDEAVTGLLSNGLAASDVNGETVPSGFSRVDAFRSGVLGSEDGCLQRFP